LSEKVGEYVKFEGVVGHRSDPMTLVTEPKFECQDCGVITNNRLKGRFKIVQPEGECSCGSKSWKLSIHDSVMQDYQELKLTEKPSEATGTQPREVTIDLVGNSLVDAVETGQEATVIGEVHAQVKDGYAIADTWVVAKHVESKRKRFDEVELEECDISRIEEIAQRDNLWGVLAGSIAPSIEGHMKPREALALSLFGAPTRYTDEGERFRGELHTALIGEPATSKSKLISYTSKLAPRGVRGSGKSVTSAGLTAAATREQVADQDQWILEAGILVLADRGLAAIDELDKASQEDRSSLHDAMASGEIHISKAGINATLKSRASLVAAANPTDTRFKPHEPLAEQFGFESSLLSRFDTIWTFEDNPDEARDADIAHHIANVRTDATPVQDGAEFEETELDTDKIEDGVMGIELYQKYISYAREICPEITDEAQQLMLDYFLDIRSSEQDSIPITFRKFEALNRLSEAVARAELSETVEAKHAEKTVEIMDASLHQVGVDADGNYDADAYEVGRTQSQSERISTVKEVVALVSEDGDNDLAKRCDIGLMIEKMPIHTKRAMTTLDNLVNKGDIIEQESDVYLINRAERGWVVFPFNPAVTV
jgi:replicative DNA helicase Mcm